jgi:hypothetical protein
MRLLVVATSIAVGCTDVDEARWSAIADHESWYRSPHDHGVTVFAQDPAAIEWKSLTGLPRLGALVACEHVEDGELVEVQVFERTGDGWLSVTYTPDGEPTEHREEKGHRGQSFQCGDCHAGG